MIIRKAHKLEKDTVLQVEREAFGTEEEASLVDDLLGDPSARPVISLLAFDGSEAVGHILFSRVRIIPSAELSAALLAPLAVVPYAQNKGVGKALAEAGFELLNEAGVELVFVLGHPEYYPRFGFLPAGVRGFEAPFPIPEEHANAWMVKELTEGGIDNYSGKIVCADELCKPEYWRE
jgi:putative acetyltransferase